MAAEIGLHLQEPHEPVEVEDLEGRAAGDVCRASRTPEGRVVPQLIKGAGQGLEAAVSLLRRRGLEGGQRRVHGPTQAAQGSAAGEGGQTVSQVHQPG